MEGFAWGWHSDGRVEPLLPDLLQCGFQFISLEPECVDLLRFKKTNGARMCLIGGIRTAWLTAGVFDRELQAACLKEIGALVREGGLVLASTCGLYRPEFLPNLKRLYQLIGVFPPFRSEDSRT
jgi:uroporphyrinogen-III decarboxylase